MQGRHFEITMARAYVYNKVRSLLAVFVAFEVLNHEDKKRGRGKTRQWIKRRDERGYNKRNVEWMLKQSLNAFKLFQHCLLYTSPSPRDA